MVDFVCYSSATRTIHPYWLNDLADYTVTVTIASQERRATSRSAGGTLINVAGGIGVALLTGLLIELAFDPYAYWPLIFVAFVPMVVAQHRILPASLSGFAPGIGIACLFAHELSGGLADGGVAW